MALTEAEVDNIAKLARLKVDQQNKSKYAQELSTILTLAEQMGQADTDNIEPMAHPFETMQPLRPDQISELNQRDAFQENAPLKQDGLYLVPKVID